MTELQKQILAALKHIAVHGPVDTTLGICGAVSTYLDAHLEIYNDAELDNELTAVMQSWPDKSISIGYPVGNWTLQPSKLFWRYSDHGKNMWDPNTRYGKARLDLLQHILTHYLKMENQQ